MTVNGFRYGTIRLSTCSLFSLLIAFSIIQYGCKENERSSISPAANPVNVVAPQITDLSSLADSQQPKQIFLSDAPPPFTMKISSQYIRQVGLLGGNQNFTAGHHSGSTFVTEAQGRGFFTTYSTEDGLALDQVNCSYMDNRGNLWFGTNGGGVSKYDGKSFVNFTTLHGLANNIIWCITEDHAGNIWFGTDGSGASRYDGERFTNFSTTQGLPDNVVFSIIEDKNKQIWFGTLKGGVSKYDGKNFTNYSTADGLPNNAVKIIKEDHNGKIWFGTLGGGASMFDGTTFSNFSARQGLADDDVWCIAEDAKGFMWFGTGKGGLSKYDGSKFTNHFLFPDKPGNAIVSVLPDGQSDMWIGTTTQGVSKFHNNSIITYTTAQGLANNKVRSMLKDKKGNIWITTYGSGLSKYAGDIFRNFTTEHGLSNNVIFTIAEDRQGALWLGTSGGGINKYDGNKFIELSAAQGLADNVINCVVTDHENNLWIGTSGGGVSKFDGESFTNYTTAQGLANNIIFSILEDHENNLWIGTSGGGVSKFDGKSFANYTANQGLANNVVFSIAEDKMGHLWFGTLGGGASKFDGNKFINYTTAQGLPDDVVWTIFQDKFDGLWFGTQNGLGMLPVEQSPVKEKFENDFAERQYQEYTTRDGLPDNFITQIIQGSGNKLYIGTNRGICELLPDSSEDNKIRWRVGKIFNSQTGYPVRDVNAGQNAMFKDRDGIIWAGTGSDKTALVRFDPNAIGQQHQTPPPVIIKNVKVNSENVCWSTLDPERINQKPDSANISALVTDEVNTYGRQLAEDERDSLRIKFQKISFSGITKWNAVPLKLRLPYYFNEIGFDFNAIETGKNFRVRYQYKLSGYDKDWTPPNYKTSVNFGNIYEGTYTFMVKAQSPEGVWNEPVSYAFTVLPPWWRTWWMYIIYSIIVIGLILILFWWNNRRIIAQKNILQHKVSIATRQLSQENQKVNAQKKQIEETLSELKSTQAQLIQSEKMASLGELTAGIAHEIKNPLNFVNNFSELNKELLAEMDEEITKGNYEEVKEISKSIRKNEEKINQHGKRADDIVKGMLQHSRVSEGQKVLTNINALADEYLRLSYHGFLAKDPKDSMNKSINVTIPITILTDFDKNVGRINIVPQDIGRVLLNLYNNAFYAVNEKSKNLKTKASQNPDALFYEPTVSVSTKKLNDKIEIKVKDNGNGIPEKVLDKIFQPFFTTKPTGQGTGLGLSLSYDIVKAQGGEITVETNEGGGTEFAIQLPVV